MDSLAQVTEIALSAGDPGQAPRMKGSPLTTTVRQPLRTPAGQAFRGLCTQLLLPWTVDPGLPEPGRPTESLEVDNTGARCGLPRVTGGVMIAAVVSR